MLLILKLNEDIKTTYRIWYNSNDPNDKNFMNYVKCIKENIGDKYLISPGKFVVEKYKYFDNNNVIIHITTIV
jgi:predicted transglutaminase-like protease